MDPENHLICLLRGGWADPRHDLRSGSDQLWLRIPTAPSVHTYLGWTRRAACRLAPSKVPRGRASM